MIINCQKCDAKFDDEYRTTICPHETFAANDGQNNFAHHPDSYLRMPVPKPNPEPPAASWAMETMQIINNLTPDIKGKAFDPDWFLLRQRLEEFERQVALSQEEENEHSQGDEAQSLTNVLGVSMAAELEANIGELRRDGRFKMAANLEFWSHKFTELASRVAEGEQLREARWLALEEAAQIAENCWRPRKDIADLIRERAGERRAPTERK